MKKKETPKKDQPKIQGLIEGSLRNGYEANDLKSYLKEKFYPRVDQSQEDLWKEKDKEREKNPSIFERSNYISRPFCRFTMYLNPNENHIGEYILRDADYLGVINKIEKALKKQKNDDERRLFMKVEFLAKHILWMALAFGIAVGQMVEMTDQKSIEAIKNVIKDKGLLPYLPREKKAEKAA